MTELEAPFRKGMAEGRLVLPFCAASGRHFWPPSPISPFVNDAAADWRAADTGGVLQSRVVYRRCFQAPFAMLMPYAVGLVALDAGPRLLAFIHDPDAGDAIEVGARVQLVFAALVPEGSQVPIIVPA